MELREHSVRIPQSERKLAQRLKELTDAANASLQSCLPERAALELEEALSLCPLSFPGRAPILHNYIFAQSRAIMSAMDGERGEEVQQKRLSAILDVDADQFSGESRDFHSRLASVIHDLGLYLFQRRHVSESLVCYRKALCLYKNPAFYVNLANSLTSLRVPGKLSDYSDSLVGGNLGKHIFIACLPKSGSSYFKNLLCQLTGFEDVVFFGAAGQFEQEIYPPAALEHATKNTVTQQHARATEANLQLLQAFGIRPVILVRNVFDCVISLVDFYAKGAARPTVFYADFESMSRCQQIDLVIDHLVPWYFEFVASWVNVQAEARLEILWVTYEDLVSHRDRELLRVTDFQGIQCDQSELTERLQHVGAQTRKNRFNRGISGRGANELSEVQKERIFGFSRHFPGIDFTQMGLI